MSSGNVRLAEKGSLEEALQNAIWMRREQFRVFETMINVLSAGLSLNPDISKRIQKLMNDYMDLVIPGSKAIRKSEDENFLKKTSESLNAITKILEDHGSMSISKTRKAALDNIFGKPLK